jgi:hypothetical protein
MFLFSYTTTLNLTISNGTSYGWRNDSFEDTEFKCGSKTTQGFNNAGCEEIMVQEPGSTVKHVNWAWPDCLVGIKDDDRDRGSYNVRYSLLSRVVRACADEGNRSQFTSSFELMVQATTPYSTYQSKSPILSLNSHSWRPLGLVHFARFD